MEDDDQWIEDLRELAEAHAAMAEAQDKGTVPPDELLAGVTEDNRHPEAWASPPGPDSPGVYLVKTATSNGPKFMFEAYWDGERWCEMLDRSFTVMGVVAWCERPTGERA